MSEGFCTDRRVPDEIWERVSDQEAEIRSLNSNIVIELKETAALLHAAEIMQGQRSYCYGMKWFTSRMAVAVEYHSDTVFVLFTCCQVVEAAGGTACIQSLP